jgi:cytochrome c-type biogenesis protein
VISSIAETVFSGSLFLAIPVALAAGFLSFASPCVLPLVPGYISYMTGLSHRELIDAEHSLRTRSRLLVGTAGFVLGFSLLFVSYGIAFGQLGSWFLRNERPVSIVMGLLVIVMGASYLGWIPASQQDFRLRVNLRDGVWTSPLLGILFGLGWAPCVGPTLAAVQSLAFTEASAGRGALLAFAYSLGLGVPFLLIALAYRKSLIATRWLRQHSQLVTRIGGAMLVLIGFALVTGIWSEVTAVLRIWAGNFGVFL